jgi:predicted ester cyclase
MSIDLVVRYFREVWERGRLDLLDELLAADFVDHDAPPGYPPDLAGHRRLAADMLAMMAERRYTLHETVPDGDVVAIRYEVTWRQVGDLFGLPADGLRLTLRGSDRYLVRAGRIAASWHTEDLDAIRAALSAPVSARRPPGSAGTGTSPATGSPSPGS